MLLIALFLGTVSLRRLNLHIFSPKPFTGGFARRMTVFLCGVIESEIWFFALHDRSSSWQSMLRIGLEWVLLFEIVSRTRRWLRPSTFPAYVLAVLIISPLPSVATRLVPVIGVADYYADPAHWLLNITVFPENLGIIASAAATVLVSYFILYGTLPSKSKGPETLTVWSGCKGGNMLTAKSQTTRLLCASAFLSGALFREQILSNFEQKSRGASPELGVDMRLVAMVCRYAKARARRFDLYLFLALVIGLIALAADSGLGILVSLLTATAIQFRITYSARKLALSFREENFDEAEVAKSFTIPLEAKMVSALPREDQNLIVYTGFNPFVGAGIDQGGWSFVVDILKPDSTIGNLVNPIPFTVEELYADVSSGISTSHLEGLTIKDYYFVSGREIRTDREILPDIYSHPMQHLNHESAQKYLSGSDTRIRHYMWIRIHDWDQELVTSYFLRFSIRGRSLFVEINRFLLTPLNERFRHIDAMTPLRLRNLLGMWVTSFLVGPIHALFTPFFLFGRFIEAAEELFGGKERARRKHIERNLLFDYGAGQGNRQAFSSNRFEHFFQKTDGAFHTKALESIILDKIISFLDEHQIDTSNLRERQNTILNSGIIVHGGDVKAESLAVGSGAQSLKTHALHVLGKIQGGAA